MKRFVDITLVLLALPVVLPVVGLVAAVCLLLQGRPVLYRQRRHGRHARSFWLYKFRSFDAAGERVTPWGRWLRRTSLDELPQVFQVLSGRLSLVGPRPLPEAYTAQFHPGQQRRLEVKPGLTGLSQVLGRNALTWDRRFAADRYYVAHGSLALDLYILWRTPPALIQGVGANASGTRVTSPFMEGLC